MTAFITWLQGKKVYILAIIGAVGGVIEFVSAGHFGFSDFANLGNAAWMLALIAAFRSAITKSGPVDTTTVTTISSTTPKV